METMFLLKSKNRIHVHSTIREGGPGLEKRDQHIGEEVHVDNRAKHLESLTKEKVAPSKWGSMESGEKIFPSLSFVNEPTDFRLLLFNFFG